MSGVTLSAPEWEPAWEPEGEASWRARADACWLLARAFMPPPHGWRFRDWFEPLLADLEDLAAPLQLDLAAVQAAGRQVAELRRDTEDGGGPGADWLVAYAALFLTPPVLAPLNTGLLLEGSLAGWVAQQAKACYQTAGFEPCEDFHDLPDHVAMQLEFMARLLDRAALDIEARALVESFSHHFPAAWAPLLQQACQRAAPREPAGHVYAALAGLIPQVLRTANEPRAHGSPA